MPLQKRGAIIPEIPSDWKQWRLCLPNNIEWRELATGLIRRFCYRHYWDDTTGDVDAVTAKGIEIVERWKDDDCEDDPVCTLINEAIDAALNGNNPDLFFTHILDYVTEHCLQSIIDAFTDFIGSFLCFQLTHLFGTEAQLSEVTDLFGLCGVNIVGYISGVRINNCNLEYQLSGSTSWNVASSLEACIKDTIRNNPPQPGGMGELDPDNCQTFTVVVPGDGIALIPADTNENTYLEILSVSGAWSPDAAVGSLWYCPDGRDFFLGQCTTGPQAATGAFPLPSGNKFEVILVGPSAHTARVGEIITIEEGGLWHFQMNDTDLTNNQGSVIVEARVCKYSCGAPQDIVSFIPENSVVWLNPWTVEAYTNDYQEGFNLRYAVRCFVDDPCVLRVASIEEIDGTSNAVSGGWTDCNNQSQGGHDCEGIAHLLNGQIGKSFEARSTDTFNSPDCPGAVRANFKVRITFQNAACP